MKLLVFGSRDANEAECLVFIDAEVKKRNVTQILTAAEPDGACAYARNYAKNSGIPLVLFFKQKHRNQGQYHHRSIMAVKACDAALFLHNGVSKGTKNEIEVAKKEGKPFTVVIVSNDSAGWDLTEWND